MNEVNDTGLQPTEMSGRIEMWTPDGVSAMLALKSRGMGTKLIAAELGCARNTVKRWIAEGGWRAMTPAMMSYNQVGRRPIRIVALSTRRRCCPAICQA